MKIAIDCRLLRSTKLTGVGNFLVAIINNVALEKIDWIIYLLSNENFSDEAERKLKLTKNVVKTINPIPIFSNIALVWYFTTVNRTLSKLGVDLFFTPTANLPFFFPAKVKSLVSAFDTVYKEFPETMSTGNWILNKITHDRTLNKADGVWTISQYSKNRMIDFFPQLENKDIRVGISINKEDFSSEQISEESRQEIARRYNIHSKLILFVGTLEPRKNLSFLLSLMPELSKKGFQLLIIGAKGWGGEHNLLYEKASAVKESVAFAGFVSSHDLVGLYSIATVFVCPSLHEGFGLPLLEAMSCGCPVVCAHNSSMIEVVEGAGETVKGWNERIWIEAILKVEKAHDHYKKLGLIRAQKYDWSDVTTDFIDYVQKIVKH